MKPNMLEMEFHSSANVILPGGFAVYIWHVRGRDFDLIVDTGLGLRPLKAEIAKLVDKPMKAVLTHSHFDHAGGAHEFNCRLGHSP